MLKHKNFQFLNLRVLIESLGQNSFWPLWAYKLDPYHTHDAPERPELLIRNTFDLEIGNGLHSVNSQVIGLFHLDTERDNKGNYYWKYHWPNKNEILLRYRVSPNYDRIELLCDESNTAGALSFEFLGRIMPSVMLKHEVLTFHGVLMEYEGRGIIISAPSGTGKTTHARMWRDLKHALIINGDRAACIKEEGKWIGYGLPWSGTSGEQINRSVPITAMVIIEQAEINSVKRLDGVEAYMSALSNLLYPSWDKELTEKALDFNDDFVSHIPVLKLSCRPDEESVEVLEKALREL